MLTTQVDPDKPQDLIECYTFNFTYVDNKPKMDLRDEIRGLSLADTDEDIRNSQRNQKKKTKLEDIKAEVVSIIRAVITMTSLLDALPSEFYVYPFDRRP